MTDATPGQQQSPTPPVSSAPKRRWGWWVLLALVCFLGGFLGVVGYSMLFQPVRLATAETVDIRPGASFGYVATRLEQRRLIPNAMAFKVYAKLTGRADALKVGEYEIHGGQRPVDILEMLVTGRAKAYWLVVPEGKWASEVDEYLAPNWPEASRQFPELITDTSRWRRTAPFVTGKSLEGFLFPDTYHFVKGVTAEQIVAKMLERFQVTCVQAYRTSPPADGRSLSEVLILASLVEAEAKVPAERPTIAGVYMNRLERGMLLQCDATVLYAHGERLKRVLYRDLEINSPYNTYRYPGLPPGPICNPGLDSFKAALHPRRSDYLYYVARGDGSHVFTRTLAEHNAAIRRIRGN